MKHPTRRRFEVRRRGGFGETAPALAVLLVACGLLLGCRTDPTPETREDAGSTEPASGTATRPSILLVSVDTTRADRLGCYGRSPSPTPNIDRWAADGVVFERAVTPAPVTLPAHTTLLTGRWPHRHGVRDNGVYRVPTDVPTLAERLAGAGYQTAAVVAAAVLDRQYGLDRGFGTWDDVTATSGGLAIAERPAADVTTAALAAARRVEPPFFLFVHYFDPHATYAPPPPFAELYRSEPYVGEIAYVDHELGRLRRELEALGRLRNTVIVIVSDHGESLGEHGEAAHGVFLYQSTLHVPLVVVAPGRWPAGRRVDAPVSLADVAPTLLALAGVPALEGTDGIDLATTLESPPSGRWTPLESEFGLNSYGWAPLVGLTDGTLKWVGAPRPELYDLLSDPGEQADLSAMRPEDVRRMRERWESTVTEDRRSRPGEYGSDREEAGQLERLAALGYVAGSAAPRPSDPGVLPDPKDAMGSLRFINEARGLIGQGRPGEARRRLEQALDRSPRSVSGLVLLGVTHLMAGEPRSAMAPLERAARLAPANAEVFFNLGLAMAGVGSVEGAETAFRRALALAPRTHDAAVNLVDLLVNTGRTGEAWVALQRARAEGLESVQLDFLEGKLAAARGDQAEARRLLDRSLRGGLPPAAAAQARALLRSLGEPATPRRP